jgi:hypothetical protein
MLVLRAAVIALLICAGLLAVPAIAVVLSPMFLGGWVFIAVWFILRVITEGEKAENSSKHAQDTDDV